MLAKNSSPPGAKDQQPGEGERFEVPFDVAIGLRARQLAERHAPWVAGAVDQQQQRQHHAQGDALEDAQRQFAGDDDPGAGKLPAAADPQVAQVARFGEVQHRRDDDGTQRRVRHPAEQRRQQDQGEETQQRGDQVSNLGAGAGGQGDGGLRQTADGEEAAEQPAQDVGGPVGD
jgi:hypothetical protein